MLSFSVRAPCSVLYTSASINSRSHFCLCCFFFFFVILFLIIRFSFVIFSLARSFAVRRLQLHEKKLCNHYHSNHYYQRKVFLFRTRFLKYSPISSLQRVCVCVYVYIMVCASTPFIAIKVRRKKGSKNHNYAMEQKNKKPFTVTWTKRAEPTCRICIYRGALVRSLHSHTSSGAYVRKREKIKWIEQNQQTKSCRALSAAATAARNIRS